MKTSTPKAPDQQGFTTFPKWIRIVKPTLRRHFAYRIFSRTNNYNLAKYLCHLLTPYIPTDYCVTDTFTFVQDIQSLSMYSKFMVSFDVESLFTNIPLEECIDLAVNYISEGNLDIKLNKSELRILFSTRVREHLGSVHTWCPGSILRRAPM